ncbi:hypothetical protein [Sutcliffiella cohnii]|uniref:hypothetical protein n=1 Tax=Sutcliffiella cohnii TaxID=33932 RepID=UPI002E1FA020|nr:hypothetical protein [Sutcliffiella cohnii]
MDKLLKITLVLLLVSVCLHFYTIQQMGKMKMEFESYISMVTSGIESNLYDVQNRIYEWSEQDRWIQHIEFIADTVNSEPNKMIFTAAFSLKEVESNANIKLLYKSEENRHWQEAESEKKLDGIYEAIIYLTPSDTYMYKIVQDGTIIKSSEIGYIPSELYRHSPFYSYGSSYGYTKSTDTLFFEWTLSEEPALFSFLQYEKVMAHVYYKNSEIKEVPLNKMNQHGITEWYFSLEEKGVSKINVEVIYADGTSIEETIYDETYEHD